MAMPWSTSTNTFAEFKRLLDIEAKTTDGAIDGMLFNNFTAQTKPLSFTFEGTDLDAAYDLIVTHNQNADAVIPIWFTPDGIAHDVTSILTIDASNPKNKFKISFAGAIDAGKHLLVLQFFYI